MTKDRTCPRCGAALPSPGKACPACLMKLGIRVHDSADGDVEFDPLQTSTNTAKASAEAMRSAAELKALDAQYEIAELLGHGGMGAVYRARQRSLDRWIALKVIHPQTASQPGFSERFVREARALAKLNHPNIVAVYDFGQLNSVCYFAMELVNGTNLRRLIADRELDPEHALALVPQLCDALQYAHDEGVVHRDIKPENILIDARGRVKIADFGLAKLVDPQSADHSLTGTNQVMGTMRYMAPEQMEGARQVDHRADIYSLGVVLYEMLTRELPIGQFEPPSKKANLDVRLDQVVFRALAKEPERRYQQADHVKTDVNTITAAAANQASLVSQALGPAPATHSRSTVGTGINLPGWGAMVASLLGLVAITMPWTTTNLMGARSLSFNSHGYEFDFSLPAIACCLALVLVSLIGWRQSDSLLRAALVVASGIAILIPAAIVIAFAPVASRAPQYASFLTANGVHYQETLVYRPQEWEAMSRYKNLSRAVTTTGQVYFALLVGFGLSAVGISSMVELWRIQRRLRVTATNELVQQTSTIIRWTAILYLPSLIGLGLIVMTHHDRWAWEYREWYDLLAFITLINGALLIFAAPLMVIASFRIITFRARWMALLACAILALPIGLTAPLTIPLGVWGWCILSLPQMKQAFQNSCSDAKTIEREIRIAGILASIAVGITLLVVVLYELAALVMIYMENHRLGIPLAVIAVVALAIVVVSTFLFRALIRGCRDLLATKISYYVFFLAVLLSILLPPLGLWLAAVLTQSTSGREPVWRVYSTSKK